ncbi:helix-turn-helix domain-containing protein [Streptomyces sp. NPDC053560]|uniref:helix-turn-helix domain-containing protein n=1 Tax=Streptomyces sp. NPDC053560 TaxID=3365711 RepID=UPI0037CDFA5A
MESDHQPGGDTPAQRFGALVKKLATDAGYDLSPGGGGRGALARDTGMSPSAVGRMVTGKTLPMPQQLEAIARAVQTDVRTLLVTAGVISDGAWPQDAESAVLSVTPRPQSLSPDAAADAWGVTEPGIRAMLLGSIQHAIRLQREADASPAGERTGAVARE